jgi:hypothetical protein
VVCKQAFQGQPFAWWIPPSQHHSKVTKLLIEQGLTIETVEHAMICDLQNVNHFAQKTDLLIKDVFDQSLL